MTESNDQGDKTAHGATPSAPRSGKTGTLTLNRTVDAGHVRQSFSTFTSRASQPSGSVAVFGLTPSAW